MFLNTFVYWGLRTLMLIMGVLSIVMIANGVFIYMLPLVSALFVASVLPDMHYNILLQQSVDAATCRLEFVAGDSEEVVLDKFCQLLTDELIKRNIKDPAHVAAILTGKISQD